MCRRGQAAWQPSFSPASKSPLAVGCCRAGTSGPRWPSTDRGWHHRASCSSSSTARCLRRGQVIRESLQYCRGLWRRSRRSRPRSARTRGCLAEPDGVIDGLPLLAQVWSAPAWPRPPASRQTGHRRRSGRSSWPVLASAVVSGRSETAKSAVNCPVQTDERGIPDIVIGQQIRAEEGLGFAASSASSFDITGSKNEPPSPIRVVGSVSAPAAGATPPAQDATTARRSRRTISRCRRTAAVIRSGVLPGPSAEEPTPDEPCPDDREPPQDQRERIAAGERQAGTPRQRHRGIDAAPPRPPASATPEPAPLRSSPPRWRSPSPSARCWSPVAWPPLAPGGGAVASTTPQVGVV